MIQIQDIKFNRSTSSLNHFREEDPVDSIKENEIKKPKNFQRKKKALVVENVAENNPQSHNNFGVATQTASKDQEDLDRQNLASNAVKMHFVNRNYQSDSDATDSERCDSVMSIESNEQDRRLNETKQWHSNLFYYKRSDAVIDFNHRVQQKFQQLKPLNTWKPMKTSSRLDSNHL